VGLGGEVSSAIPDLPPEDHEESAFLARILKLKLDVFCLIFSADI